MLPTNVSSAAVNGETLKSITTNGPNALGFKRLFAKPGHYLFDEINGELRTTSNLNPKGRSIFEQRVADMPAFDLIDSTPFKSYHPRGTGCPEQVQPVEPCSGRVGGHGKLAALEQKIGGQGAWPRAPMTAGVSAFREMKDKTSG